MQELSLHILDIVENSLNAGATRIGIEVIEDTRKNVMELKIVDNGSGLKQDSISKALDPFYTTDSSKRTGLGLSLLAQAAKQAGGKVKIESKVGEGTTVLARFVLNHVDRQPLGNISDTIIGILGTSGDRLELIYKHCINDETYVLDTRQIKQSLQEIRISHPQVLGFLRENLELELNNLKKRKRKNEKIKDRRFGKNP